MLRLGRRNSDLIHCRAYSCSTAQESSAVALMLHYGIRQLTLTPQSCEILHVQTFKLSYGTEAMNRQPQQTSATGFTARSGPPALNILLQTVLLHTALLFLISDQIHMPNIEFGVSCSWHLFQHCNWLGGLHCGDHHIQLLCLLSRAQQQLARLRSSIPNFT